ncbi:MAG: DUF5667 domain-containing protein [Patescibacteria group bacterium]
MNTQHDNFEKQLEQLPSFEIRKRKELLFFAKLFLLHFKKIIQSSSNFLLSLNPFYMGRIFKSGVVVAAVFLVLGTAFSYNAGITRGHFLYPLKRAGETVRVMSTFDAGQRVDLHLDYSGRRLDEVRTLLNGSSGSMFSAASAQSETPEVTDVTDEDATAEDVVFSDETVAAVEETVSEVVEATEDAMETVDEDMTDPTEVSEALDTIEEAQEEQLDELSDLSEDAPVEVTEAVDQAVDDTAENLGEVVAAGEAVDEALEEGAEEVDVDLETGEEDVADDEEEEPSEKQARAEAELVEALATFESFKAALEASGFDNEKSDKFVGKVEDKLAAAQAALADGNYGKAYGMLKAAQAHTNVQKSFGNRQDFVKVKGDDSEDDEDESVSDEVEDETDDEDSTEESDDDESEDESSGEATDEASDDEEANDESGDEDELTDESSDTDDDDDSDEVRDSGKPAEDRGRGNNR